MNSLKKLLLVVICLFSSTTLFAQNNEPLADEMKDLLKNDPFNVGILIQSTANYSFEDDGFNGGRNFGLGVARLRFGGNLDNNFSYVFQMEFLRQLSVIDLALGYEFSDQFKIVAGAQKPDIGLDLQPNPGDTDFINRARLVGTMLNTREIGISGQGSIENFDYNISVFNGQGLNTNNDGNFMYLAKVGYSKDLGGNQSLYVGGNGFLNTTENEAVGNTGFVSDGDRIAYGIFAEYDSDEWFGSVELLGTNFETGVIDETITGFYTTAGNKVTEKDEILARWEHQSFDVLDISSNLFTIGWNHQATSVISFQVNALTEFIDGNESFGLSGNFQFQF
ncbi:MAG: porin [Balneolaceae bacterium]